VVPSLLGDGPKYSFSTHPFKAPLMWQDVSNVDPMVGFGYRCNFSQHTKYGKCIDRRCSERAPWEKTTAWVVKRHHEKQRYEKELIKDLTDVKSPLHFAVIRGEFEMVCEMLLFGADPDARDEMEMTPLHYASSQGDYRSVKRLIENSHHPYTTPGGILEPRKDAQVNLRDKDGNNELHHAALQGHWWVAQLLFQIGCRCDLKSDKGRTPLDLAKSDELFSKVGTAVSMSLLRKDSHPSMVTNLTASCGSFPFCSSDEIHV